MASRGRRDFSSVSAKKTKRYFSLRLIIKTSHVAASNSKGPKSYTFLCVSKERRIGRGVLTISTTTCNIIITHFHLVIIIE